MRPLILLRRSSAIDDVEEQAMAANFQVIASRLDVQPDDLVVGRMSVLPYYKELSDDIQRLGAKLINTPAHHRFVADMINYVACLDGITPPTFTVEDIPWLKDDPAFEGFVLKGETNSKKFLWDTHMWAPTAVDVKSVMLRLFDDTLISSQRLHIRRKARLRTFMYGPHGLPITNEYRTFVAWGEVLSTGFYWSNYVDDIPEADRIPPPKEFLEHAINRVYQGCPFFAIDTGMCEDGSWTVIELNDGQMSGLSECDPEELYSNLHRAILNHQQDL